MSRGKIITWSLLGLVVAGYLLGVYWSVEPERFNVQAVTKASLAKAGEPDVEGATLTTTVIHIGDTLLDKPGGFLSNDVLPPSVFLDNMPAWEFGALEMLRDTTLVMRNELSRSQSQSSEDPDLKEAQPEFNVDRRSWAMPRAEAEYRAAIKHLLAYRKRLSATGPNKAEFYGRADNLRELLRLVEKRLGSYSQRLAASVGQESLDEGQKTEITTSWWQLDDVFYEARGYSWALLHVLKAVEVDFGPILKNKHAMVSLRQIIRDLESTQQTVWSPMILNGSGFGLVANHSLVMANYISRANAALVDLQELLDKG